MRRLAIISLLTPMVFSIASTAHAQACQNFQQQTRCDPGSVQNEVQSGVRQAVCDNMGTAIKQHCVGDGNSCTDFKNDNNFGQKFNDLNQKLQRVRSIDVTSNGADATDWVPDLMNYTNRHTADCSPGTTVTPSTANCQQGMPGYQNCLSNAFKQQVTSLQGSIANCRMERMLCECEADRAKGYIQGNANLTSQSDKDTLKTRVDDNLKCAQFDYGPADSAIADDQAQADSLKQQAANTSSSTPGNGNGKNGDSSATKDDNSDDSSDKDKKKKSAGGDNPLKGLTDALQQMAQQQQQQPQPQPQTPPDLSNNNCSGANMVGPGCPGVGTQSPQTLPRPAVNAGFQTADASAKGFNPADTSAAKGPQGLAPVNTDPNQQQQPLGAAVVANNSGGSIPQSQGGGAPASSGGGIMASLAKPFREILNGTTSYGGGGGYAATNEHLSTAAGGTGGFSGYGKNGEEEPPMRLADFLPNGARAPAGLKGPGGLGGGKVEQIQDSRVNIWNRISDHFKSRCAQGLLRDCFP